MMVSEPDDLRGLREPVRVWGAVAADRDRYGDVRTEGDEFVLRRDGIALQVELNTHASTGGFVRMVAFWDWPGRGWRASVV